MAAKKTDISIFSTVATVQTKIVLQLFGKRNDSLAITNAICGHISLETKKSGSFYRSRHRNF